MQQMVPLDPGFHCQPMLKGEEVLLLVVGAGTST